VYERESLSRENLIDGPVVIEEWSTTILILPGQQVTSDRFGNLVIDEKN
jgi:N-methylhydantoinase A/oxoprolinase/acetone carboxylase beta subunit